MPAKKFEWEELPLTHNWRTADAYTDKFIASVGFATNDPTRYFDGSNWSTISWLLGYSQSDDWAASRLGIGGRILMVPYLGDYVYVHNGTIWKPHIQPSAASHDFVSGDMYGDIALIGGSSRLWQYNISSEVWTELQPAGNFTFRWEKVAIHSGIMAAIYSLPVSSLGYIYASTDGGDTWQILHPNPLDEDPKVFVGLAAYENRLVAAYSSFAPPARTWVFLYDGSIWHQLHPWEDDYFTFGREIGFHGNAIMFGIRPDDGATTQLRYFDGASWSNATPDGASSSLSWYAVGLWQNKRAVAGQFGGKLFYNL